jgi:hypothetical protein
LTQIRSSLPRRLAVPLGLSLAAHAILVAIAWLAPSTEPGPATEPAPFTPLSLTLGSEPDRLRPALLEPASWPGLPDDVDPHLVMDKGTDVHVGQIPAGPPGNGGSDTSAIGGSGPAKTARPSILAAPAEARRVAYVLDRSISMGTNNALTRATAELLASLRGLPAQARFQVIVYNGHADHLLPAGWLAPDAATLANVEHRLGELTATGRTDHARALRQALVQRPDVLFWVTDADELTEVGIAEVTRLNAGRTRLYVVELAAGRADGQGLLARLAKANGGGHRRVSPLAVPDDN